MSSSTAYGPLYSCRDDGVAHSQISVTSDLDSVSSSHVRPKAMLSKRGIVGLTLVTLLAFFACMGSYSIGRQVERAATQADWLSPPGHIDHTFRYRHEFGMRPGNLSQKYWDMIFPRGRGFVQHPVTSPLPHGLTVYHQLHCLVGNSIFSNIRESFTEHRQDALRHGYWAAKDGIEAGHKAEPGHVRHCIDYLRQSIMCNADTNLEPINQELGGVTGFGFSRKCRDIVRIMAWADQWRTHNQTDHT